MNDSPNFSSILDEAPTEVIRPEPLPVGTYLCVVGQFEREKSSKKQTPYTKFPLRVIAALDDVDPDLLEEAGGIDGKMLSVTFYETEDAIYRLDEFHEHCGLDLSVPLSRKARNDEVINAEVLVYVRHRQSDDKTRTYAEVSRTLKPE